VIRALGLVRCLPLPSGTALARVETTAPVILPALGQVEWVPLEPGRPAERVVPVLELHVGPDEARVYVDASGAFYDRAPG